jgi:hypothetical protein
VNAGERKSAQVVIELSATPARIGMAVLTSYGKASGAMIRIGRAVVIRHVARYARRTQPGEDAARCAPVAGFAIRHGVGGNEGKAIRMMLQCVDLNTPALHGMAAFAR